MAPILLFCVDIEVFLQFLTHVIVSCDGNGRSGAGTLLGEVVAESEDAGVVLQHGGDLHLHRISQLLPLHRTGEKKRFQMTCQAEH